MHQRPSLPILALLVSALAVACDGGGDGTDPIVPSQMQITAGDGQSGPPGTTLSEPLEVKVTDDAGRAAADFTVSFSASSGSVSPQSMDTDTDGRARTTLTLPDAGGSVTVTASGAGVPDVEFVAESVPQQLGFRTSALPAARIGIPYGQTVEATGGTGGDYAFEVIAGGLPLGMALRADGSFDGASAETGTFPVTIQVTDGEGDQASRSFTFESCTAPVDMDVGDVRVMDPSRVGECGVWIPNDRTDRYYRVALIRANRAGIEGAERDVTATVTANGVSAAAASASPWRAPLARSEPVFARHAEELRTALRKQDATARFHGDVFREAEGMIRRLGPGAVAPSRRSPAAVAAVDLPQKLRIDIGNSPQCEVGQMVTAIKIGEDDRLAIFQDSTQNAAATTRVSTAVASLLLDYYEVYGEEVIETYFGGVADIDSNGKVIVFITPATDENVLGYVWPGDMFDKSQCAASNEAELIYMGVDEILALTSADQAFGLGLGTLVHEMKHVSSVWERLQRAGQNLHPLWEEEGSAEIASTRAARVAWHDVGGPEVTATVVEDHWRAATGEVTNENVSLLLQLFRLQAGLAEQPNSIIVNTGNGDDVYGTGWLFQRWLGDVYGNASQSRFADASLFRTLNGRASPSGVEGLEGATGQSWQTLLDEFMTAMMYNGTPAADVAPKPLTSWDLVSAVELFCFAIDPYLFEDSSCNDPNDPNDGPGAPGAFPWPVTTTEGGAMQSVLLESAVYTGSAGQGGYRVHDFRTNGTGRGAEINIDVQAPARVVVVRIL
ncbi:MAG: Ig-like domain-containing protein [Gemmatimonadota bacterium]|jgi:hypothetical protein